MKSFRMLIAILPVLGVPSLALAAVTCDIKGEKKVVTGASQQTATIRADNEQAALAEFRRAYPGFEIVSSRCK